ARLRGTFESAEAWKPGYEILLKILEVEGGHNPEATRKAGQRDPGFTGCQRADAALLPAESLSIRKALTQRPSVATTSSHDCNERLQPEFPRHPTSRLETNLMTRFVKVKPGTPRKPCRDTATSRT